MSTNEPLRQNQQGQYEEIRDQGSFVRPQTASAPVRILSKIDIFSFIPVPKDDPASTKQSLIGTALFFIIFFTYIIFDFYQFVTDNPPNAQNYYTKLDDSQHKLPRFAIAYMDGFYLENADSWDTYFEFKLSQQEKDKGSQKKDPIKMYTNWFKPGNGTPQDTIDWLDNSTKSFYNVLRTSSRDNLVAKGLLYSTNNAEYARIKVGMCNLNQDPNCKTLDEIKKKCAQGRIFLFIENIHDTTAFSMSDNQNANKFLIYNFFLVPFNYKRVTFNFQVVQTVVQPDWFFRLSQQKQTRLQIQSYLEQTSDVTMNFNQTTTPLDMLAISFQLSPQVLNVRVTYKTLIDLVSLWGAFWGVLFAVFAAYFLTYNRKKFYKKNPGWDKFKQGGGLDGVNTIPSVRG